MTADNWARPADQALVSDQARAGLDPAGFDPSRLASGAWVRRFADGGEEISVRFDTTARYFADRVEIQQYESRDNAIFVSFDSLRWLVSALEQAAQAIEARRAATTGAVEDESAVPEGMRPNTSGSQDSQQ